MPVFSKSRNALLVLVALSIGGCANPGTEYQYPNKADYVLITQPPISSDVPDKVNPLVAADDKEIARTLSRKFAVMALFAQTSYRKEILDKKRDDHACDYLTNPTLTVQDSTGDHLITHYQMPRESDEAGWERWVNSGACYSRHGLFFETYIHRAQNNTVDEAVIAIRGTENSSTQWKGDWMSNASGAFPTRNNEYNDAKYLIPPVIAALGNHFKDVKIYLSGHSLGGGIAQEIAYLIDAEKHPLVATYTFNTSPVTYWTQLGKEEIKNEYPVIHRAYMNGEGLQYLRKLTKLFNTPRYSRTDYEFNFYRAGAVKTHDMAHLLCGFAKRIGEEGAEHYYSGASARDTLGDGVLCPEALESEL